jgi:hypothetical protein
MKRFQIAALAGVTFVAAAACSSAPQRASASSAHEAFSTSQANDLGTLLSNVVAEGDYEQVTDDGAVQDAVSRLDGVVGADAAASISFGTDLQDGGTELDTVTLSDGTVSNIIYHTYVSADSLTTVNFVRVEDVSGTTTMFADRDLVQFDDNGAPTLVSSSLFNVDDQGNLTQLDNAVGDSQNMPTIDGQSFHAGLRLQDNGGYGNSLLCGACVDMQYWLKGASWFSTFLALHHVSVLGCAIVGAGGAAAGAVAGSEVPVAGNVAGGVVGAAEAYRGCRIVATVAAALALLGPLLPAASDTDTQRRNCNTLSTHLPYGPWCGNGIGPSSCELGTIQGASSPQAQCIAIGQCAHDSGCPAADGFCNGLFFGNSSQAGAGRSLCGQIAVHACGADIQSSSDLASACSQITGGQ